jgi:hypothetical protein
VDPVLRRRYHAGGVGRAGRFRHGAAGKASFSLLLSGYALAGELPVRAAWPAPRTRLRGDLAWWLFATRAGGG